MDVDEDALIDDYIASEDGPDPPDDYDDIASPPPVVSVSVHASQPESQSQPRQEHSFERYAGWRCDTAPTSTSTDRSTMIAPKWKSDSTHFKPVADRDTRFVITQASASDESFSIKVGDGTTAYIRCRCTHREPEPLLIMSQSQQQQLISRASLLDRGRAGTGRPTTTTTERPTTTTTSRLWVDVHAPSSVAHLLSDEGTNRGVLKALRAWDRYVFRTATATTGRQNRTKEDLRPDQTKRVILLSGPPGVGKTTLAHVACRHVGYRPIEVNASDERTASTLVERITRAMQSTLTGTEGKGKPKPNCVILDEVDGADARTAIAAIAEMAKAGIDKKGSNHLRRPIILICNHRYAPALRPILPYSIHFGKSHRQSCRSIIRLPILLQDVPPPHPERLASRLRAVLAGENATADMAILHKLVAATSGDIRSCIHSLQWANASGGDLSRTLLTALDGGRKDVRGELSNVVTNVFRTKRRRVGEVETKGVDLVLDMADRFGDNSKLVDCLFVNVNRVSFVDPTMDRCSEAFEWLSGADLFRSFGSRTNVEEHLVLQNHYMPSAAAAVHMLCRIDTRPDLTFSTRELSDLHFQNEANSSLVRRFMEGLSPRVRSGVGSGVDVVVSDVIPYGLWLLSAGEGKHSLAKPASSVDILSSEEKLAFRAHVATLRALGLTYVRDYRQFDDGNDPAPHENVRLEPEIDKLVKFEQHSEGYAVRRKPVPSVLRELLAHAATLAALRERDGNVTTPRKEPHPKPESRPNPIPNAVLRSENRRDPARTFLNVGAAKAKEAKTARRAARVGFDRSKTVKLSNTGSGVELSNVIRFKFCKGFTQAVRAPCQIEDLM